MFVISLYKPYFSANSSVCLIITLPKPHPLKVLSTMTTKTPRKIINNTYTYMDTQLAQPPSSAITLNHHPQSMQLAPVYVQIYLIQPELILVSVKL